MLGSFSSPLVDFLMYRMLFYSLYYKALCLVLLPRLYSAHTHFPTSAPLSLFLLLKINIFQIMYPDYGFPSLHFSK